MGHEAVLVVWFAEDDHGMKNIRYIPICSNIPKFFTIENGTRFDFFEHMETAYTQ
jgi:hypothetical protein